jgi:hypothetical protein
MSARRIDKTIGLAVLALAVVLALVPLFVSSPSEAVDGSVASTAPHGRRALFLLVQELRFAPEIWNEPPGRLPRGEHLLWLASAPHSWKERQPKIKSPLEHKKSDSRSTPPAVPNRAPDSSSTPPNPPQPVPDAEPVEPDDGSRADEDDAAHDGTPVALERHALSNYRRFVEEGGTLVMHYDERARNFLRGDLAIEAARDLELDKGTPAGVYTLRTESGEELRADWPEHAAFRDLARNGRVRPLWTTPRSESERDEVLAVVVPVGSGRLVLLGDDGFLDNVHLREQDHGLLAVRLAELLRPGGRLLFDEFALGLWQPHSASSLATSPQLFLITGHLVLLACLFVWARAWVSSFPRDPPALARISPLSRARSRAALCQRARRYDLLAGMLRRGSLRRWGAIVRLRVLRTESATPETMASEIGRIAERTGKTSSADHWRGIALRPRVRDAADLEALARDLDAIGAEIEAAERRSAPRAG